MKEKMDRISYKMDKKEIEYKFLTLWDRAILSPEYDKKLWTEFQQILEKVLQKIME